LFSYDTDREAFLGMLAHAVNRFELGCVAYCLMGNHYHLLVQTPDERLSQALQQLNGGYSRHFNLVHGRGAHLFRNRFLDLLIEDEQHLLAACRYLAHNPVRAGLCGEPADWPWSSYRASAGIDPAPAFLAEGVLRGVFGAASSWRERYRDFIDQAPPPVDPSPGKDRHTFATVTP
jgi:REP element-mobilizing transposase RayT